MEAELRASEEYLGATKKEEQALIDVAEAVKHKRLLINEANEQEPAAESAESKFVTFKGVSKWKPKTLIETELSFHYIGPCPNACVALSFQVAPSVPVKCNATARPKLFQTHGSRTAKELASVTSFIQIRIEAVCALVRQQQLSSLHEIRPFMHNLEWQLGRIENTASEFVRLKRRYRAVLTLRQPTDVSNFQLEIDFKCRSGSKKLRAAFDISDSYPFSPLNVCLETFDTLVDVEAMRKLLIKNAKPGFGYLSRTCDVIAAYLQLAPTLNKSYK